MDPRIFRGELRVKLTVQALIRQENSKVPPATREEAEDFYKQNPRSFDSGERVHCRRILIPVEPGVPEGARAVFRSNAEAILKRVKSGQDFAKVARETSGDKDTAAKGGDLGVLARSQMSEAAAKAAFALKPREVSDVVETPQGFEILKLEERKEPVKLTFEQAQNQIRLHLDSKKRQEALQALVGSLRSKARIETFL